MPAFLILPVLVFSYEYPKYWYKKTACIKLKKYERGAFFLIKSPIYIYIYIYI